MAHFLPKKQEEQTSEIIQETLAKRWIEIILVETANSVGIVVTEKDPISTQTIRVIVFSQAPFTA